MTFLDKLYFQNDDGWANGFTATKGHEVGQDRTGRGRAVAS